MGIRVDSFSNKGLEEVFRIGRSKRIGAVYLKRVLTVLDYLDGATGPGDLQGVLGFHALTGDRAGQYAMRVSGNWRLTFRFDRGDVIDIDFEDYH
jgi:proteic killer suppression protein